MLHNTKVKESIERNKDFLIEEFGAPFYSGLLEGNKLISRARVSQALKAIREQGRTEIAEEIKE